MTVPEREITYAGWQGVGYIIQDPTTGAGACLITGGAAGAEMLAAIGVIALALSGFVKTNALIVEGDTNLWGLEEFPIIPEIGGYIIAGATFLWGYLPKYEQISTTEGFLAEIANPQNKIFYFIGHGWDGGLSLYGGKESVRSTQITGSSTSFTYVHIDACKSASVAEAFDSHASLGYNSYYASAVDFWYFDIPYLLCLCVGSKIKTAKDYAMGSYSSPGILSIRKWFLKKAFGVSDDNLEPKAENEEMRLIKW